MSKKILVVLSCAILSTVILSSCNSNSDNKSSDVVTSKMETTTAVTTTIAPKETTIITTTEKQEKIAYSSGVQVGYKEGEIPPGQYTVYPNDKIGSYAIYEGGYDEYINSDYNENNSTQIYKKTTVNLGDGDYISLSNARIYAIPNSSDIVKDKEVTVGESNALKKAYSYLNHSYFSPKSLKEQLEYEGFSGKDSKYAVDNCGADWNEQAAGKAQEYLNSLSLSREGLKEQLEYEGFNESQITYALSAVGY